MLGRIFRTGRDGASQRVQAEELRRDEEEGDDVREDKVQPGTGTRGKDGHHVRSTQTASRIGFQKIVGSGSDL